VSCVWLLKRQIAYQRETIFQRGCEPQPTIFFFQKKKNLWRLPRIATLISFSTTYIFCFFLEGYIFVNRVFSQKSSMTNGNEITDVFVFEGDIPTLPPKHPAREARVRVLSAPELRSSWFWGGGDGDASPARPRRKTTGNRPRACCCSPLRKRGGGSGTKRGGKRGGRGKGTLGEGKSVIDEE